MWPVGASTPQAIWDIYPGRHGYGPEGFLFPTLAMQLAAAIASPLGLFVCDECGLPYAPRRRPRPDRRHYCAACSAGVSLAAKRQWARERRAASRPAGEAGEGITVSIRTVRLDQARPGDDR
jgi:hypothetical protein